MWWFLMLNILGILLSECVSKSLPVNFPKCDLGDPDLDNCILKATEELKPQIAKGIEAVNIPAFEPFRFSGFDIVQESQAMNYTASVSNCSVDGLNNYRFNRFQYNPKTLTFSGNVEFDSVTFHCFYSVKGDVISIPVEGKGKTNITFEDCSATFAIGGRLKNHSNVEYFTPINTKVIGTIADGTYHLTGLFDENEQIAQMTINLLNQNSKQLSQALVPLLEDLAEMGLLRLLKSFTRIVPYKELFSGSHPVG